MHTTHHNQRIAKQYQYTVMYDEWELPQEKHPQFDCEWEPLPCHTACCKAAVHCIHVEHKVWDDEVGVGEESWRPVHVHIADKRRETYELRHWQFQQQMSAPEVKCSYGTL